MGYRNDLLIPSAEENALILAIDVMIVAFIYFAYSWAIVDTLGLAMLIEAAVLMLTGGAMEFGVSASGRAFVSLLLRKKSELTEADYRKTTMRASTLTLVGVLLFLEALAVALLVG